MFCYQCGHLNPGAACQCQNCGVDLRVLAQGIVSEEVAQLREELAATQEMVRRLKQYVPPVITDYLLHDQIRLRGERREIAVLFADAVNFTQLSASLDAEAVFNLINDLLSRLVACVHRYEGLVDKFTGDGLMAIFGAPVAHENDAEMAMRAALDMQKVAAEFAPQARSQLGAPLKIRVGIHAGLAISGILGTAEQSAYTVIGDTVNIAARMEAQATPGHILVSERVYVRTEPFFKFKPKESTHVKGMDEPIITYEVLGTRATPMPTRGIPGVTAIFLGHETELSHLRALLADFLADGRGRMATVRGEAGMGKSRLVTEWLQDLDTHHIKVWHGRGLPYVQGVGYGVFRALLQNARSSYFPNTRWDQHITPALRPFLKQVMAMPLTEAEALPFNTLPPERIKQLTALAMRELITHEAREHPLILILDDFHWADELSRDLLKTLSTITEESSVMFCIITRPHAEMPFEGVDHPLEYHRLIDLTPLTARQSRALLGHLVNLATLPEPIIHTILERADGNPFYIEEFVRMLIEKGLLNLIHNQWQVVSTVALEKVEVPTSLRGLMLARVDRLPENLRNLLRDAAVIGLQFDTRLLQVIEHHFYGTENVAPLLERLTEAGLLETRPEAGPQIYAFRHILTQETVYNSILRNHRPELHRVVAEAIRTVYRDDLHNHAERLALHYDRARVHDKALHYTIIAGDRARQQFANHEAIEYYSRALQISQHLSHHEADRWQAAVGLGEVYQHIGEYEEAIACYRAALDEWKNAPPESRAEAMLKLGGAWVQRGGLDEAETWLRQALNRLHTMASPPPDVLAETYSALGWLVRRRGDLLGAQEFFENGLDLVEHSNHYQVLSSLLNRLGAVYYHLGDWEQAATVVERAIAIREDLGDLLGVARSSNNLGILKRNNGDWIGALENYHRCLEVMEQIGDIEGYAIAHTNIGNVYIDMGVWQKAESHLQRSFDIAQRIANPYEVAQAHLNLGRLYLAQGDLIETDRRLDAAISLYDQAGVKANPNLIDAYWLQGVLLLEKGDVAQSQISAEHCHELLIEVTGKDTGESAEWGRYERLKGRQALARGNPELAIGHLERARDIFQASRAQVEVGRTLYWYGLALLVLDRRVEAIAQLEQARDILQQLGAQHDLARAQDKLAEISASH